MSEPTVAPYGGYIVKSLEDEKENEQKLKDESIEVEVNGEIRVIRPEAIHISGVDKLSTDEIKSYVDFYMNYTTREEESIDEEEIKIKIVYEPLPFDDQLTFKVEWIDDSSINIVFKTSDESKKAYVGLCEESVNMNIQEMIHPKPAKSYQPIIQFKNQQSLSNRLGLKEESDNKDYSSIDLFIRQSFQSDRKIKNASQFSRYYLIHGEPERKPRRRQFRDSYRPKRTQNTVEEEDLFADKLKERKMEIDEVEEEDLFAEKLKNREKSPTRVNFDVYRQR